MGQITTNFPNHLDKSIKKVFTNMSKEAITNAAYSKIFKVYDTNEYVEAFTSDEGIDDFAALAESQDLVGSTLGEGYKTTLSSEEFGKSLTISHRMILRAKDDTVKLAKLIAPKEQKLIYAANRFIEKRAHALLLNAFSTDTTPTLAPDGLSLINDAHTWNSTTETFDNDLDAIDFSAAAWDTVQKTGGEAVGAQGTGDVWTKNYDTIVVMKGSANARTARRLFGKGTALYSPDQSNINIYETDNVRIIETPYFQSAPNRWFALASGEDNPLVVKFIERPTLHEKQVQTNMDVVYPCTMSFEAGVVNMPLGILGSTGS